MRLMTKKAVLHLFPYDNTALLNERTITVTVKSNALLFLPSFRNTIDRQNILRPISQLTYDVPRLNPILVKLSGGTYVEPSSGSSEGESEDEASYYR